MRKRTTYIVIFILYIITLCLIANSNKNTTIYKEVGTKEINKYKLEKEGKS